MIAMTTATKITRLSIPIIDHLATFTGASLLEGAGERLLDHLLDVARDSVAELVRRTLGRLRLERREALVAVDRELVDPLMLNVLQMLLAEVDDGHALGKLVPEQSPRRLGEEDLAAVPCGADARRADDVEPEIALIADRGLAGVQTHPHAHRLLLGPRVIGEGALSSDRAGDGVPRPRERVEEGVPLCVDLCAALVAEMLPQKQAMVADDIAVGVPELLEEPRRALDIGEEKRHRAAREHTHAGECMVEIE